VERKKISFPLIGKAKEAFFLGRERGCTHRHAQARKGTSARELRPFLAEENACRACKALEEP
jgi:hypothetical protein